jgi:hypothetical protein
MNNYIVTTLINGFRDEHICTKEVDKCNNIKYVTNYGTVDEKYIVNIRLKDEEKNNN